MSAELSVIDGNEFNAMEKVAEKFMHGETATAIAKELNLPRKEVNRLYEQYNSILREDQESRDIARDTLNIMVKHYDSLIKQFYQLVKDLDELSFSAQVAAQRNSALKEIGNLERTRLDALQKAGLLDASDLGDELVEMERKQELLIKILRNDLCQDCQRTVARKLQEISNVVEVIQTVG